VAGAASVRVAGQNRIVTGLLRASFVNALGPILVGRVAPVDIAANHASVFLRASSTALQFSGVLPRLFGSLNGSIESKKSAECWNVINDEKRDWTDSPNSKKS
jgi:hypothetical protein